MTRTLIAFLLGIAAATALFTTRLFATASAPPEPSARCEPAAPATAEPAGEEDGRALDSKLDALEREITSAPAASSAAPAPTPAKRAKSR